MCSQAIPYQPITAAKRMANRSDSALSQHTGLQSKALATSLVCARNSAFKPIDQRGATNGFVGCAHRIKFRRGQIKQFLLVSYCPLAPRPRKNRLCVLHGLPFRVVDKHLKHPFKACIALGKQLPRSASPSALQSSQTALLPLQRTIRGAKALRHRRGAF